MLRHMREANKIRASLGRGPFKRGPKVSNETTDIYEFQCEDSLEDHLTDVESGTGPGSGAVDVSGNARMDPTRTLSVPCPLQPCPSEQIHISISNEGNLSAELNQPIHGEDGLTMQSPTNDPLSTNVTSALNQRTSSVQRIENAPEGLDGEEIFISTSPPNVREQTADEYVSLEPALTPQSAEVPQDTSQLLDDEHVLGGGEDVSTSRIPGFFSWLRQNQKWVDLFYKHGLTNTTMDDILRNIDAPCRSWKTVMSNIQSSTPVVVEDYPVCPGHYCFATKPESDEADTCPICAKEKPSLEDIRPQEMVSYIPLVPRIKAMIEDGALSDQLYSYRKNLGEPSDTVLRDYFDSDSFARLSEMYGGSECLQYDIFIAASTDGFQAFQNNSSDVWPVLSILLNLPPHLRFNTKNVLPLMYIPNDVEPKNLQSYLIPFVNELISTLENGGVEAQLPSNERIRFRIHLVWFSADLAAIVKLAGVTGHNGRFPCRFCLMEGFYCDSFQHYYYPSKLLTADEVFSRLDAAQTSTEKRRIGTETGVKERSVLFNLPNFKPFNGFPPDIMHLFYNVQMELLQHHLSGLDDGFALRATDITFLDEELVRFADGISGQLGVKPRTLGTFKRWKAAEHKAFTISYALVLFDGYLEKGCLEGLSYFVRLVDICFRSSVSKDQAKEVRRLSIKFIQHYESYYMKYESSRINYCKYVIHLLLHLGDSLLEYGPLMCTGQYWVEKFIGWIGGRCNAKTLPAKSMLQTSWFGEAKRLFFREPFHNNEGRYQEIFDQGGNSFLGPSNETEIEEIKDMNIADLFAAYLVRKHNGLNPSIARGIAGSIKRLKLWSRLEYLCGSDVQTSRAETAVAEEYGNAERRPSCYVAVEMDDDESSADIYYGKVLRFIEVEGAESHLDGEQHLICNGTYRLAAITWAQRLMKGGQGQVFKIGSRDSAFGSVTLEDVSIIRRLIGVVQHSVPASNTTASATRRRRKQTYFIDDFQRIDNLLSSTKLSEDGINRRLRGMSR